MQSRSKMNKYCHFHKCLKVFSERRNIFYNWLGPFDVISDCWFLMLLKKDFFLPWRSWCYKRTYLQFTRPAATLQSTHLTITPCTCVCATNIFYSSSSCILTTTLAKLAQLFERLKDGNRGCNCTKTAEKRGEGRHHLCCSSSCVSSFRENLSCDFQTHAGVTGGGEAAGWF